MKRGNKAESKQKEGLACNSLEIYKKKEKHRKRGGLDIFFWEGKKKRRKGSFAWQIEGRKMRPFFGLFGWLNRARRE